MNGNTNNRPILLTIFCWLNIIGGIYLLILISLKLMNWTSPIILPIELVNDDRQSLVLTYVQAAFYIVSGIFMLRGAKWARFLYIAWIIASCIITFNTFHTIWKTGIYIRIIILSFLTKSTVIRFFDR